MTPYTLTAWAGYVRKAIIQFATGGGIVAVEAFVPSGERQLFALGVLALGSVLHFSFANTAKPGSAPAVDDGIDDGDAVDTQIGASVDDVNSVDPIPADVPADTPAAPAIGEAPTPAVLEAPHPRPTPTG